MTSGLPIGKVPPDLLGELVYSHLGTRRSDVLVHAEFGEDCAAIDFGDEVAVVTTDPITGAGSEAGWYAVHVGTNDLAATGAEPVAVFLTVLLAPGQAAEDLGRVMRDASGAAAALGIEIAGGHSEVTARVDRTIVVTTAVGRARKNRVLKSGGARVGDALLLTKGAGIEGTAILATALETQLAPALGRNMVASARAFRNELSVLPEARAAVAAGASAMHDVTEGGVLGAAYEISAASGIGLRIDSSCIPIRPETAAICAHLGIEPLALIGSGALLIATPDAPRTAGAIDAAGIRVAAIGRFTLRDRVMLREGRETPLCPPSGDEVWRILGQVVAKDLPRRPSS